MTARGRVSISRNNPHTKSTWHFLTETTAKKRGKLGGPARGEGKTHSDLAVKLGGQHRDGDEKYQDRTKNRKKPKNKRKH